MRERVNPETGHREFTITEADQKLIGKTRDLLARLFLGHRTFLGGPAKILYDVQEVTVADRDGEYAEKAEKADDLLQQIGWPKEKAETKPTKEGTKP